MKKHTSLVKRFMLLVIGVFTLPASIMAANLFPIGNAGIGAADDIPSAEEAFVLSGPIYDGKRLHANWQIADQHYMYRERFKMRLLQHEGVAIGELSLPSGKKKQDPAFGEIQAIYQSADVSLPLQRQDNAAVTFILELAWQGCNEALGVCHPPQRKAFLGQAAALAAGQQDSADWLTLTETALPSEQEAEAMLAKAGAVPLLAATASTSRSTEQAQAPKQQGQASTIVSEQDQIANNLKQDNIFLTLLGFLGFGLLLSFTPCVFPMIPILSGIIAGQKDTSARHAFILSLVYVLAMAVTYTVFGIIAGLFGSNLQAVFQQPWILISFSLIFVLLSLSMFGFYELQMPTAIQNRLNNLSQRQAGGTLAGVAIMGILSALIVGPCVAAPLMGALIYIGQTGDAVLGGAALFALSIGMGIPLLLIGASAGHWLPKTGAWMEYVKAIFGVMLLAVAIWMLERILPENIALLLWSALFVISALFMGALSLLPDKAAGWRKLWKGLAIMVLVWGILLLVGSAIGKGDIVNPLRGLSLGQASSANNNALKFTHINNLNQLNQALKQAQGKPVMLDFYADWCVTCKEMEKYTFPNAGVKATLQDTVLLKADVTANDAGHQALMKHFNLIGPPAMIFFNPNGQEIKTARLIGFLPPEDFITHMNKINRSGG